MKKGDFRVMHSFRQGNMLADYMAKLAAKTRETMPWSSEADLQLTRLLLQDARMVAYPVDVKM